MTAYGFNTSLLHGTKDDNPFWGDSGAGFYQSSAFRHASAEELGGFLPTRRWGFFYTRINNPTIEAFEKRITLLEHGWQYRLCLWYGGTTNAFMNIFAHRR